MTVGAAALDRKAHVLHVVRRHLVKLTKLESRLLQILIANAAMSSAPNAAHARVGHRGSGAGNAQAAGAPAATEDRGGSGGAQGAATAAAGQYRLEEKG